MNNSGVFPKAEPVISPEDIVRAREVVRDVYMDEKMAGELTAYLRKLMNWN